MKISIINIIVSVMIMTMAIGLFYFNRRPSEIIDDLTLITLLKNAETNASNQWKAFPSNRKFKNDSLQAFAHNLKSPVLMLRIKETSCQACVSNELEEVKKLKENGVTCVLLATYNPATLRKLLRIHQCKDIPFFTVPNDCLYESWYAEQYESPFYFVLHPNRLASDFFLPEKTKPELTEFYFNSITPLLTAGQMLLNSKYQ